MDVNINEAHNIFYGLPTDSLCEILELPSITPIYVSPYIVDGLVNIGGSVMAQLDIAVVEINLWFY